MPAARQPSTRSSSRPRAPRAGSYHHGDLRAALIVAGLKVLAREGWEGFTLRTVARAAGVSPAAPYRHFKDAGALAAAIAEQGFDALRATMSAALGDRTLRSATPLERTGHGYVRFARENPDHLRLMFAGTPGKGPEWAAAMSAGERAFGLLLEIIAEGQAAGHIEPGPPQILALAAWSLVHGLSTLLVEERIDLAKFGFTEATDLATAVQRVARDGWRKHE